MLSASNDFVFWVLAIDILGAGNSHPFDVLCLLSCATFWVLTVNTPLMYFVTLVERGKQISPLSRAWMAVGDKTYTCTMAWPTKPLMLRLN